MEAHITGAVAVVRVHHIAWRPLRYPANLDDSLDKAGILFLAPRSASPPVPTRTTTAARAAPATRSATTAGPASATGAASAAAWAASTATTSITAAGTSA